jgi:hypothetical protein
MIATYKGGGTELTFSADTMFDTTSVAAAGSAQRLGDVAPVTPERTVPEEDIEEDINKIERKEKILGRLLEYGTSQLSSMRAAMAKTIWRSIKARLAWRETPERAPDDDTPEGRGDLFGIKNYHIRTRRLHPVLDEEGCCGAVVSCQQVGYATEIGGQIFPRNRVVPLDRSCC